MKHKTYSKRTVIAASVILVTIVCAILGLSTLRGVEKISIGHNYADNFPLSQDQKRIKEIELIDVLRNYDKNNISEAYVFLGDSDGEITNSSIMIICREKIPNIEMQSEIKSLVSEEIGLDIQNIYIDYMDFESFTSL